MAAAMRLPAELRPHVRFRPFKARSWIIRIPNTGQSSDNFGEESDLLCSCIAFDTCSGNAFKSIDDRLKSALNIR